MHSKRFSVFFEKLSNLLECKVRFPMHRQPEIAILILFRRCLRPQARFGAQPPLAAALSAQMLRNSARLVFSFRRFFDTLSAGRECVRRFRFTSYFWSFSLIFFI